MTAVKQNYGEKVLVQVDTNFLCMVYVASKPFLHLLCLILSTSNDFCSLKTLQITMLLSCLLNMVQHILFSMTIYR